MHYALLSISHKNCDLATREKLAFGYEDQEKILKLTVSENSIEEAAILVTCNRIELIVSTKTNQNAYKAMLDALSSTSKLDSDLLIKHASFFEDNGATRHLFSVASGLESVVVGETQIVGQFKDAFAFAKEKGYAGKSLNYLLNYAIKCAAEVRSTTEIGKNPVSVSSAAVVQARMLMGGHLSGVEAVVIGTGEMSRLAAQHLVAANAKVTVIARDIQKGEELASELGGDIVVEPLTKVQSLINEKPLMFTATGAPHTVINQEIVDSCGFDRFWFDIAVPRDIGVIDDENIKVFTVDDLQGIVETNMSLREDEATKAFVIVDDHVKDFYAWLKSLSADPIIKALRDKASKAALDELDRAIKKGFLPKEYEDSAVLILHNAFKRFLHSPTIGLKTMMEDENASCIVETINRLFDLKEADAI